MLPRWSRTRFARYSANAQRYPEKHNRPARPKGGHCCTRLWHASSSSVDEGSIGNGCRRSSHRVTYSQCVVRALSGSLVCQPVPQKHSSCGSRDGASSPWEPAWQLREGLLRDSAGRGNQARVWIGAGEDLSPAGCGMHARGALYWGKRARERQLHTAGRCAEDMGGTHSTGGRARGKGKRTPPEAVRGTREGSNVVGAAGGEGWPRPARRAGGAGGLSFRQCLRVQAGRPAQAQMRGHEKGRQYAGVFRPDTWARARGNGGS